MSDSKPTLLIFGATGAQGGSIIDYLEATKKFNLRAVSRNVQSEKALALIKRGVEMVTGDFVTGIPSSVYEGVYGVFLVTNFWDPSSMGKEWEQSIPVIDAAFTAGVKQFVYSTLSNCYKESNGKFEVAHFTTKGKIEDYVREKGFQYTAFPAAAFYYQNFQSFFPPKADENGNLSITMPVASKIAAFDVTQIGGVVTAIFSNPEKFNGQFIAICGENQSPQFYVDAISEKIGKKVTLNAVPVDVFVTFPFPGAHELGEMFAWFDEYGYYGKQDPEAGKQIDPSLRSFKEWLTLVDFKV
jgi:uncharacterized protein YbjT (DUF2867 family)